MAGELRSPRARDPSEVPEVAMTDYMLERLRARLPALGERPWLVDVNAGTQVKFCDVESQSRRVASALSRRGFKKGHVLYYVTYEMAHLYVVQFAVWRLGGAVRGCFQGEAPAEYVRQLRETGSRMVVVDADTVAKLHEASTSLEWSVEMLSVGNVKVPGATSFQELLEDDGTAFPENVEINSREDIVTIPNTSGSTGMPKGVLQTHHAAVAMLKGAQFIVFLPPEKSVMTLMTNYAIGNFMFTMNSLCDGVTIYNIGKFTRESYFQLLTKYKPSCIMVYPYVATWFVRTKEIEQLDLSFIQRVYMSGWVLDPATAALLSLRLPNAKLLQLYGITETMMIAFTGVGVDMDEGAPSRPLAVAEKEGKQFVSSGHLLPYVQAKVVDPGSGETLEPGQKGEILVKSPSVMKGYLVPGKEPNRADIDADGWFHTGDLGFVDSAGNFYVIERLSFMFKYNTLYVSPSEIEALLQEHSAVQAAGVVGVPHPETDNLARAFVVLRPDRRATAAELQKFVAQRLPPYKHLHGGVRFVPSLPVSRGGKMDRTALSKAALDEGAPGT